MVVYAHSQYTVQFPGFPASTLQIFSENYPSKSTLNLKTANKRPKLSWTDSTKHKTTVQSFKDPYLVNRKLITKPKVLPDESFIHSLLLFTALWFSSYPKADVKLLHVQFYNRWCVLLHAIMQLIVHKCEISTTMSFQSAHWEDFTFKSHNASS